MEGDICAHKKILNLTLGWRLRSKEDGENAERWPAYKSAAEFQVRTTNLNKAETKHQR